MADFSAFFAESWHRLKQAELYRPHPNPTFANPRWEASPFRVLALRLSPYRDVDRSTPHLFLAQAVREAVPPAYVDFCFFPVEADRRLLAASGVPLITGLESGRTLEDFDLALISCAYHLELLNLPFLLQGSGVPHWASERTEAFPPLLLGGSSAMSAQALLQENGDCLADGLFFGEGEGQVAALVRSLFANRGLPKRPRLAAAADAVEGFWPAGDLARPVRQAVCRRPESLGQARPYPLLPGPEAGTARLAVTLGCPFRCSFCFEGYERRPYRRLPADGLLQAARALKQASGARTVELASFNVNTHPDLPRLLAELNRLYLQVNFMSQRTDILSSTPGLLELELAAGKRGYTLGIEGISARQRGFLQKHLAEPVIRQLLARLLAARVREVKLFYVLSGHETGEDFREFRTFLGWLRSERERHGKGPRLIFSFNRLMRMPFTPLAHDRLLLTEGTGSRCSPRRGPGWRGPASSSAWPPPGPSTRRPRSWRWAGPGSPNRSCSWPGADSVSSRSSHPPPGRCCGTGSGSALSCWQD